MRMSDWSSDVCSSDLLRWLGGANGGCESAIAMSAGATLTLTAPPPFAADAGTMIELIEGCDKSFATCRQRFDNVPNFRGEPFLPGIDLLTRYPGGRSEEHTSELQSLMRISYAVFCLNKKKTQAIDHETRIITTR